MRIPKDLPPINPQRGDVTRECLAASEVASVIVVPRSLKEANEKNGVARLHAAPKKDPYKGYFKDAKVRELPHAGGAHVAALPVFRRATLASGHDWARQPKPRTYGV